MTTLETVPHIPQHLQPTPDIAATIQDAAERAQDAVRAAYVHMQTAAMAAAERRMQQWDDMPRWRKLVGNLGVTGLATTLAIVGRSTGAAAHGLEESGLLSVPSGGGGLGLPAIFDHMPHTSSGHDHAPAGASAHHDMVLAAHVGHDDTLPADLDDAPDLGTLGPYEAHTGHGTVWHQVVEYAEMMGYGHLSEAQKHDVVGKALDHMGLSWDDARHLHANYQPDLPSQHTMSNWLDDVDAHRTHAPDRAPAVDSDPTTGQGSQGGTPTDTSPAAGAPPVIAVPHVDIPWYDREIVHIPDLTHTDVDWVNVGVAAVTVLAVSGGAVQAGRAYDRRAALRREARLRNADTQTIERIEADDGDDEEERRDSTITGVGYVPGRRIPDKGATHDVSGLPDSYVESRNSFPASASPAVIVANATERRQHEAVVDEAAAKDADQARATGDEDRAEAIEEQRANEKAHRRPWLWGMMVSGWEWRRRRRQKSLF